MWSEPRPRVVIAGEALDRPHHRTGRFGHTGAGGGQYNAARALARLGGERRVPGAHRRRLVRPAAARRSWRRTAWAPSLVVDTADPTTLVLAEIDEAGVAHYHWYIERTTVPGLELEDALKASSPAPDALHVGTLGLAMEPIADSLAALVAQVPDSTFVMVDPNCRPTATPDFERYQARMRRIIARADVVKGSDEDFEYLALAKTPEATARLLLEQGVGAVLVTQGSDDARGFCAGGEVSVPVPKVQVVGHRRGRGHLRGLVPGLLAGAWLRARGTRRRGPAGGGRHVRCPRLRLSTARAPEPSHRPARRWAWSRLPRSSPFRAVPRPRSWSPPGPPGDVPRTYNNATISTQPIRASVLT